MALPTFGLAVDEAAPRDEIVLQPPPMLPKPGGGRNAQQLLYVPLPMLGMGSMSALYLGRGGSGPLTWVIAGVSALGMVGMVVMTLVRGGAQKKGQINDERRDYLRYLANLRGRVRDVARRQVDQARTNLPAPQDLWTVVGTDRMWRRRRGAADFACVRVATGPQLLETPLRVPETAPLEDLDPVSSTALRRFVVAHATVPGLPVTVSLRSFGRVGIGGERAAVLALARAVLAQLATFHSPAQLRIAACLSARRYADWEWLNGCRTRSTRRGPTRPDRAGSARAVSPSSTRCSATCATARTPRTSWSSSTAGASTRR